METPKITTLTELKSTNIRTLRLGDLKKLLDKHPNLPDDTPVMCQRVEDQYFTKKGGWSVVLLPWESRPYDHETDAERLAELEIDSVPGTYKVVDRDGQKFLSERTQYMDTFGAYVTKDDEGNEALCLHAHY